MDILNIIFSWQFIFATCILADIYCLLTIKHDPLWKYRKLYNSDINLILNKVENMDGREFEEFMAHLFRLQGNKVQLTPSTNDHGVDILIDDNTYVECKHWNKKELIGRPIVSKLVGSAYALSGGNDFKTIIITTSGYNQNAIEYAKLTNTELWDMEDIIKMVKKLNSTEILRYLDYDRKIWEAKSTVS